MSIASEIEIYDPDDDNHCHRGNTVVSRRAIEPIEIEATTALLRRIYGLDLEMWASEGSMEMSEEKLNEMRNQSEAAWTEVWDKVQLWKANQCFGKEEQRHFEAIVDIVDRIGKNRYT